jgi:hypothetical protein
VTRGTLTEALPDTTNESCSIRLWRRTRPSLSRVRPQYQPAAHHAQRQRRRAHLRHLPHPERQHLRERPQWLDRTLRGRDHPIPAPRSLPAPKARARRRRLRSNDLPRSRPRPPLNKCPKHSGKL